MKKIFLVCLIVMPLTSFATNEAVKTDQDFNLLTYMPWIITIISLCITAWQVFTTKQVAKLQNEQTLKIAQMQNEHALKLAKLNHNSTIVSNNRMQYLKEVRDTAVEISTFLKTFAYKYQLAKENGTGETFIDNNSESLEKLTHLFTKMTLLLNPDEQETQTIISLLDELSHLYLEDGNSPEYNVAITSFRNTIQIILNKEWKRIKAINAVD